ncbi:MAG: FkbM family methyltransferase [Pseudanabaenaceae cyanobacterium]
MLESSPSKVIFDLGAAMGGKAETFRHYGRVVCVEPSTDAVAIRKMRFAQCPEVTILEAAIAERKGVANFFEFSPGSAYNTLSEKRVTVLANPSPNRFGFALANPHTKSVDLVTIDQLRQTYGDPEYIKIEVEGFELPAVKGMSRPCPLLSTEFHLPEFADELTQVVAYLEELGGQPAFNVAISEPPGKFEFSEWLSGPQALECIWEAGWQYIELFCRTQSA